jgi:hypothetical protein
MEAPQNDRLMEVGVLGALRTGNPILDMVSLVGIAKGKFTNLQVGFGFNATILNEICL